MANYYGSARTNYFRVKDIEAFEREISKYPGIEFEITDTDKVCMWVDDDFGGWPAWYYDEENDIDIEIDIFDIVSKHLKDNEVAIFMESGAEKLRYINGYSIAVNNNGGRKVIALDHIYDMAKDLTNNPDSITRAEY